jgi:hypothetical protein
MKRRARAWMLIKTTSSGNAYFDMAWQGTVCVCVCVHDNCSHECDSCDFFSCSVNVFFYTHPPFMYFDSVGLSSHPQNTIVTGAGGDSDEEKCSRAMDVDQDNELR